MRYDTSLPGKDATEDFFDVGHSDEARSMMDEENDSGIKIIGKIDEEWTSADEIRSCWFIQPPGISECSACTIFCSVLAAGLQGIGKGMDSCEWFGTNWLLTTAALVGTALAIVSIRYDEHRGRRRYSAEAMVRQKFCVRERA